MLIRNGEIKDLFHPPFCSTGRVDEVEGELDEGYVVNRGSGSRRENGGLKGAM